MSQLGIPGALPSGVGCVTPLMTPDGLAVIGKFGTAGIFDVNASLQIEYYLKNMQEATGAGTPQLGTNSPATVLTAPYKWIKMQSSDGTIIYIPAWK